MVLTVKEKVEETELSDDVMNETELLAGPEGKSKDGKRTTLETFHETSETEIAFQGDHGDSDDSMDPPPDAADHQAGGADDESEKSHKETGLQKNFNRLRRGAGKVVNDDRFQLLIVVLIVVNAIMMGIATFDFVQDNDDTKDAFQTTDRVFLVIFTIELALQFLYHGIYLFLDGWLVFDFIIVVVSWAFDSLQIIRAFRIFRALRLITRLEVLRTLVVALFAVMPRMAAISALLLLVFYIYGVLCTYLFKDLFRDGQTDEDYFSRLDLSFFTLFQIMTLEDWGAVARQVMEVHSWSWLVFVSYAAVTSFIVYNLIIAVVCDAVAVREHEHDLLEMQPEESTDFPVQKSRECQKRIVELNQRLDALTKQQQQLLKAVQDVFQELDEVDKT